MRKGSSRYDLQRVPLGSQKVSSRFSVRYRSNLHRSWLFEQVMKQYVLFLAAATVLMSSGCGSQKDKFMEQGFVRLPAGTQMWQPSRTEISKAFDIAQRLVLQKCNLHDATITKDEGASFLSSGEIVPGYAYPSISLEGTVIQKGQAPAPWEVWMRLRNGKWEWLGIWLHGRHPKHFWKEGWEILEG